MDMYYVGSGGLWSDSSNWSFAPGGIGGFGPPGFGDRAIFESSSTDVVLDSDVTVDEVILQATYASMYRVSTYGWKLTAGVITVDGGGIDNETGGPGTLEVGTLTISGGAVALGNCNISGDAAFNTPIVHTLGTLKFTAPAGTQQFTTGAQTFNVVEQLGDAVVVQLGVLICYKLDLDTFGTGGMWDTNGYDLTITGTGVIVRDKMTLQLSTGTHIIATSLDAIGASAIQGSGCTLTVNGNFSLSNTASLSMPSGTMIVDGGFNVLNTATVTHNNGTLRMTGAYGLAVTLRPRTSPLYNVIFEDSGAGATLYVPNAAGTCTVANDFTLVNGTVLLFTGDLAVGRDLLVQGGTMDCNGRSLTVGRDLVQSGGDLTVGSGTLTVVRDLSFTSPGNCNMGSGAVTTGGLATMIGAVTLTSGLLKISGDSDINGSTVSHNGGTIEFNGGAGNKLFNGNAWSFNVLRLSGAETLLQQSNLDAYQLDLLPGAGTWDVESYGSTLTVGAGGMTMNGGALLLGDQVHTWNGPLTQNGGTITLANGVTSQMNLVGNALFAGTLTMLGAGSLYVYANLDLTGGTFHPGTSVCRFSKVGGTLTLKSAGNHFYDVNHGDTVTVQLLDALTVDNDLTLQGGTLDCGNKVVSVGRDFLMTFVMTGTFTAPSTTLSVAGNFTKSGGTFNHNGGTVVFTNPGLVSVFSTTGLTTFNNLTFGASKTHRFTAGQSFRVNGALASNGTAATRAVMVSSVPGTYWNLRLAGTSTLANKTNITDCDASAGVLVLAVGSTDGGHNLNIDFAGAPPVPAVDFPVGANIPAGDEDWFYQYDLDPSALRAWNTVGNWAFVNNQPALVNCGCFSNGFGAPPGIGDTIEFRFVMTMGRYNFRFWCPQDVDCGIVSITMNGYVIEPALDLYAAPAEPSYVYLFKNRVLVPAGLQRLVITVTGKNGASSDFYARMYGFQFAPHLPQLVV